MPIDIALLAGTAVTSFLMPYIRDGAQRFAEQVTTNASATAADHVSKVTKTMWERVKSVFTSDKEKTTLAQFEEYPEEAAPLVQAILKKKLEQDSDLARELQELVHKPSPDGTGDSWQIMARTVGIMYAQGANIHGVAGGVVIQPGMGNTAPDTGPSQQAP